MALSDYWNSLGARQRIGLIAGTVLIVASTVAFAVWLFRDPFVPLARDLDGDRLSGIVQALERARIDYRVDPADDAEGDSVSVPRSLFGRARATAAANTLDAPPSVGLELFKETDFSTTDFAQRINYQRALQGELTRTLQTIAGVRTARVHVILPEAGLFKRDAAKATAAVSISMQPGKSLTRAQVAGIQRLVAASVPEIKTDDVVVLDDSGASLTRAGNEAEGEVSSAQLELKRQVDQYFETKLAHLLEELSPDSVTSLSVDTTLDERQLRVTTEEPIGVRDQRNSSRTAGIVVRERQAQHGHPTALTQTDGYAADSDSTDWEYEYKVGNRVEQTLSAPGSIKRISVAVAIRGAPAGLSVAAIEQLVGHAVGADASRGDSVSVMLLPPSAAIADRVIANAPGHAPAGAGMHAPVPSGVGTKSAWSFAWIWCGVAVGTTLSTAILWWSRRQHPAMRSRSPAEDEAVAAQVRQWLAEGADSGRA